MQLITQVTLIIGFFLLTACSVDSPQKNAVAKHVSLQWQADADIETFWLKYAESKGGLTWGQSTIYPEYNQVNEGDTFMVELDQGLCLMEFFHNRWRRANDVRRWDDSHNAHGGCPFVFN